MILDFRSTLIHKWRSNLSTLVWPIQVVVNKPIEIIHDISVSFISKQSLLDENAKLRAQELLLQSQLQKLYVLQKENDQLKQLLLSSPRVEGHVQAAQLLAVSLAPELQQVVLDKGQHDSVYVGQPVLDAYGVIGQVVDVAPLTSKILLITDQHSAIPVQDYRNGLRAVAVGTGDINKLQLINVTQTMDVRAGDLFVTSGLGLRYPVGYPVGVVSQIKHEPRERFAMIELTPSAHLEQTQQVLLASPDRARLSEEVKQELAKSLPDATTVEDNHEAHPSH